MDEHPTVVAALVQHARERATQTACRFLIDGDDQSEALTYGELDRRARALAWELTRAGLTGERAILLFEPGLDFIVGFFGCLYAGVIAVPVSPPNMRLPKSLSRLMGIAMDASVRAILTTTNLATVARPIFGASPGAASWTWFETDRARDDAPADEASVPVTAETVAFLQYTSGSTGDPKGVVLRHENLAHNCRAIYDTFRLNEHDALVTVTWLPLFHDMGLIGVLITTAFAGGTMVFMSPAHFLQRPLRWLRALTKYKGTYSPAPNFAFELCARKVDDEALETLDLSAWKSAPNGAEPVRQDTLAKFTSTFAPVGFAPETMQPCFGLAEGTLLVTGRSAAWTTLHASAHDLMLNRITRAREDSDSKPLVSSGRVVGGQRVRVVDPQSLRELPPNSVGEVLVSGPSIAQRYWNNGDSGVFTARVVGEQGLFLRTGDLGFVDEAGELYITGRSKDLIILRGQNYYPQDVEAAVEASHPAMRVGRSAAFTVEVGLDDRLVVVTEFERRSGVDRRAAQNGPPAGAGRRAGDRRSDDPESGLSMSGAEDRDAHVAAADAAFAAISEATQLSAYQIVLIRPGQVPKTSSGKIMRRATRSMYLAGEFDVLHVRGMSERSFHSDFPPPSQSDVYTTVVPPAQGPNAEQLREWIDAWLTERYGAAFVPDVQFAYYGIDSRAAVRFIDALSVFLGRKLSPLVAWEHPTVNALVAYLTRPSIDGKAAGT